jgi:fatty-acyl-CoA synthase
VTSSYAALMERACRRFAARVAFSGALTYAELWERAMRLAGLLQAHGVGPGSGVAVLASNSPEFTVAMIACAAVGCRYTPLHPLGGAADQQYILADARVDVLVFSADRFEARARALVAARPALQLVLRIGEGSLGEPYDELVAAARPLPAPAPVRAGDDFALSYTGGTTGTPKGVLRSHATMIASAQSCALNWELPSALRFLIATPMSHGAGTMVGPVMLRGGTVTCIDRFSADELVDTVQREAITATFLVPTMLYALLEELGDGRPPELDSLETVLYGGAPANPAKLEALVERLGPRFMQFYGQTEVPNAISMLPRDAHLRGERYLTSAGWALYGTDVSARSADGEPVAPGDVGELAMRSEAVMKGYWGREAETQAVLRDGWLYTGDLATIAEDGLITIVGRSRDVVISGGFNVYPAEVERVISALDGVRDVAVVGVPDSYWGECVTAFVVRDARSSITDGAIRDRVRSAKGPVASPKRVVFLDAIPVTGLGKPDRAALRALPEAVG